MAYDIPEEDDDDDIFYDCEDPTPTSTSPTSAPIQKTQDDILPRNTVEPTTDDTTALTQRFSRTDKHRTSSRHEQAHPPYDPIEEGDDHALQDCEDGYEDAHQKSFEDE
ncbi:hypothetical protein EDB89DRAFT_1912184 [Lactarius sanguifluus]|nr:hypothetical protein EDB89DRAFT_1913727 [Lactarius sanguifluus]KAH9164374.1 hypothetical protein EDB89DRAFT_1912184 [Lactarius sanguifluus]